MREQQLGHRAPRERGRREWQHILERWRRGKYAERLIRSQWHERGRGRPERERRNQRDRRARLHGHIRHADDGDCANSGRALASPTLSPDQREIIYTRIENSTELATFVHSIRGAASDEFPAATPLPELDAACQTTEDRNADLSTDGLRAYIVCFMDQDPAQPTLHIADRASLQAAFVVRPKSTPIGGISVAISRDELTLYSNGDYSMNFPPPLEYQRGAMTDDFGSGAEIPELAGAALNALEPSPDGLAFYAGYLSSLVSVTRSSKSGNFGTPSVLVMQKVTHDPTTLDDVYGSPELSQDCRSLYFVQQELSNPAVSGSIWVMRR